MNLIIFMLFGLIAAMYLYFLFYIRVVTTKHSEALKLIDELNDSYKELTYYSAPCIVYKYMAGSKKELNDFDHDLFVVFEILKDADGFIKKYNDAFLCKKKYAEYLNEFNLIVTNHTPSKYFSDLFFRSFLEREELKLCDNLMCCLDTDPCFEITTKVSYVSPAGRNNYSESILYSGDDVIEILHKIIDNNTHLVQLNISCNKKNNCDMCGVLVKNRSYDWSVDGVFNCVCPSCNRELEKKLKEQIKTNNNDMIMAIEYILHATKKSGGVNIRRDIVNHVYDDNATGMSVTEFVKKTKQPRGGYLSYKNMDVREFMDGHGFIENENIHHTCVGLVVDYMTRFMYEKNANKVFSISLMGALIAGEENKAFDLIDSIKGLDSISISSACKLVGYDSVYRAGVDCFKGVESIIPDERTISNISIMVQRSINCFSFYGGLIDSGMTFEGGYTKIISSGDADFLTKNIIWEMKVSKKEPTIQHTLQIIIYYLLLKNSQKYKNISIDRVGIFNPRINKAYTYYIDNIGDLECIAGLSGFNDLK